MVTEFPRSSFVRVPEGAAAELRAKFRVPEGEKLRLCYLSIADDAARVQQNWAAGRQDPLAIKQAHAAMFFEAVEKLEAEGLMLSRFDTVPVAGHPVRIAQVGAFPDRADKPAMRRKLVEVEREIDRFDPHAIILAQSLPVWTVPQFARKYPALLFLGSLQWPLPWDSNPSLKERLRLGLRKMRGRRELRHVRGIVSGSKAGLAQVQGLIARDLPSAWDMPQFTGDYLYRARTQARKLIYCGPLLASNDVFVLLNIVRKLGREVPGLELAFVGHGADAGRLAKAAGDLPNVRVEPDASHALFRELMAQADLCIASFGRMSQHGALDMLYAAGLCGVPALVSSGLPIQPYQQSSVLTVEASDHAALETGLRRLVLDDQEFVKLTADLPPDRARHYDEKNSFGTGLVRVLQKMNV